MNTNYIDFYGFIALKFVNNITIKMKLGLKSDETILISTKTINS